jgi:uncharacterized protein (TIGR00299 family) protein
VRILYFDCFAGAAGDMILGALLDAGLPFDELKRALGSLAVDGIDVSVDRVMTTGVTASKFRVHEHAHAGSREPGAGSSHPHHHLKHIFAAIDRSALSDAAKARAVAMFRRLGEVEAAIHNTKIDKVHLHEVGSIDSIIDIVGAAFAMEWFKPERVVVSPINVGGGMVNSAHGVFPVPAPATLALLKDTPVYSSGVQMETLTPTGALILTEYATAFGPVPAMTIEKIGYGAGDRDMKETPNVVRVLVGTEAQDLKTSRPHDLVGHRVSVLECEKKNRPGTLMTIVCAPDDREAMTDIVFRESTTIGIRHQELSRVCLEREMVTVSTPLGAVRFKVARRGGRVLNAQPEFEDLAKLSTERGIPVKEVQALAQKAWLER